MLVFLVVIIVVVAVLASSIRVVPELMRLVVFLTPVTSSGLRGRGWCFLFR